jgi:hypothetical protein
VCLVLLWDAPISSNQPKSFHQILIQLLIGGPFHGIIVGSDRKCEILQLEPSSWHQGIIHPSKKGVGVTNGACKHSIMDKVKSLREGPWLIKVIKLGRTKDGWIGLRSVPMTLAGNWSAKSIAQIPVPVPMSEHFGPGMKSAHGRADGSW